jgi:hypothetical protein
LPAVNQKTAEKFIVSGKQHSVIGLFGLPPSLPKNPADNQQQEHHDLPCFHQTGTFMPSGRFWLDFLSCRHDSHLLFSLEHAPGNLPEFSKPDKLLMMMTNTLTDRFI